MEKQATEEILKTLLRERGTSYLREGDYFVNAVADLGGSKEDVRLLRYLVEVDGASALLNAGGQPPAMRQTIYSQTVEKICVESMVSPEFANKICAIFWRAVYEEEPPVQWPIQPPNPQKDSRLEESPDKLFERAWEYDQRGNMEEAVKLYRQAADRGNADAQYNLGVSYEKGEGVSKNLLEAVKWYRMAAEQGKASAQYNLGLCYRHAKGVAQNLSEAARWYSRAAEQGQASAQCNLGSCYEKGEGVSQNDVEATKWYQRAANQGLAIAQYNLGICYEFGRGVSKDLVEAARWYRLSADQGDEDAKARLCKLVARA